MGVQKPQQKTNKIAKKGSKSQNKIKKYENEKNKVIKVKKDDQGKLVKDNKRTENIREIEKKQKEKILNKKQRLEQEGEKDFIEHFDKDGFFILPQQMQVSQADEDILKQFSMGNTSNIIQEFQQSMEEQKQQEYKQNILADPRVKVVYGDIAKLLKTYRSGKLARAFKIIPQIEQWEDVLKLTKPEEWSAQGMNAATKCFASNLDPYRAKIYYENYLLPAIRQDIQKYKKLNCHYYFALQKALYKPAAWFKGILFALLSKSDCTLKEAQIIGSVLQKMSIPNDHSSVAILKLSQLDYSGPIGIILRVLIEKKYALPIRVIQNMISFFTKFLNDERTMPVIWHQLLLRFVQLYYNSFTEQQKTELKRLVKVKNHHQISPEIIKGIDGQSDAEQKDMVLE